MESNRGRWVAVVARGLDMPRTGALHVLDATSME